MLGINLKLPGANFGEHTAAEKPKVFVSLGKRLQGAEELEQLCREQRTSISEARRRQVSKGDSHRIDGAFYLPAPLLYLLCCVLQLMGDFHLTGFKYSSLFLMAR